MKIILSGIFIIHSFAHAQNDTSYIQWDTPQQITFDQYHSVSPNIVAVGDTVHLKWTTNNGPEVFYARSINAGVSWSDPVVLDDTTSSITPLTQGSFAAALNYGYVYWTRCEPPCTITNVHQVLDLRRSTDGGASWLPRETIASDGIRNSAVFSTARDTMTGFVNTRSTTDRFAWS